MDTTTWMIIGAVIIIGAAAGLYYYRKRSLTKMFEEVYQNSHQIPKQNKNSFLLLMFRESLTKPKDKNKKPGDNLKNQKFVQIQMIQMNKVLKDTSKVTDKSTKRALAVLTQYQAWEKKLIEARKAAEK